MNAYLMKNCDYYLMQNSDVEYAFEEVAYVDDYFTIFLYINEEEKKGIYLKASHDDEGNVAVYPVLPTKKGYIRCSLEEGGKVENYVKR